MAAAREFDFFDSDSDTHELLVDEIRFLLTQQIDFYRTSVGCPSPIEPSIMCLVKRRLTYTVRSSLDQVPPT